jgi:hypothetical protein
MRMVAALSSGRAKYCGESPRNPRSPLRAAGRDTLRAGPPRTTPRAETGSGQGGVSRGACVLVGSRRGGLFGPRNGSSFGFLPGSSSGLGGSPGSCTGGGTSGRGLPGGLSGGGSVGFPGLDGGISGGSVGIYRHFTLLNPDNGSHAATFRPISGPARGECSGKGSQGTLEQNGPRWITSRQ